MEKVMKQAKKFVLAAGVTLATMGMLNSCKNRAEKEAEAKRAKQEQLDEYEKAMKKQSTIVWNDARDSVYKAHGYDRVVADSLYSRLFKIRDELQDLSRTQKDILGAAVDTIIIQKSRVYADEMLNLFKKYNLHVNNISVFRENLSGKDLLAEQAYSEYFDYARFRTNKKHNPEFVEDELKNKESFLPYSMFGNSKSVNGMRYNIDWAEYEYGENRQKEIQNAVLKILARMNHDIDNALRAEVKKFAVYYPKLDLNGANVPAEYKSIFKDYDPIDYFEGDYSSWGFEHVDQSLSIGRSVRVYDSKLDVNFFGEPDMEYKLVKVAKGKWQVTRKDKNGNVSKTPVFSHNVDYEYGESWGDERTELHFEPGANMGVHIYSNEVLWSKKSEKSDEITSPEIVAKKAELNKEYDRISKERERMYEIQDLAEKIARQKYEEFMAKTK